MSRRPFRPDELDQPAADADGAIRELEQYAMTSDSEAPHGLSDRIMAAVGHEPAPRRGLLAWLTTPSSAGGGPGRFLRIGALAATLMLAVAAALYAGQLADLIRDVGGEPTPTPTVSPSPSEAPSLSPTPSSSVAPSPSATPEDSVVPTVRPTPDETPDGTPDDTPEETKTPRPSPTVTASPQQTPES
jgi:hypothetical protein